MRRLWFKFDFKENYAKVIFNVFRRRPKPQSSRHGGLASGRGRGIWDFDDLARFHAIFGFDLPFFI